MPPRSRLSSFYSSHGAAALLLALVLPGLACAQDRRAAAPFGSSCEAPFAEAGRLRFDPSGWQTDFCQHSVPYAEIRSGGPPRDGIPPLDNPRFASVPEADGWLADREPVILLRLGGVARAYPLQVLMWHEIANDRVAGTPVAVTFCPLCNAALVFRRPTVDGEVLTFGTTGNLRHSDLVMWDRQTESWWQQFTGEAIVGRLTGRQLDVLPAPIVAWETFRARFPNAQVLSRETGYNRPYGQNPYAGYDDVDTSPFMYDGAVEGQRPPMARVVGIGHSEEARAYPLDVLQEQRAINDRLGGTPLVVWWQPGAASALDAQAIAEGRDVGQTGAFRRTLKDGRTLTFRPGGKDEAFVDEETGSTWNVLGEATGGPLQGRALQPVPHHDIFWFVWSAFRPGGGVYSNAGAED